MDVFFSHVDNSWMVYRYPSGKSIAISATQARCLIDRGARLQAGGPHTLSQNDLRQASIHATTLLRVMDSAIT